MIALPVLKCTPNLLIFVVFAIPTLVPVYVVTCDQGFLYFALLKSGYEA